MQLRKLIKVITIYKIYKVNYFDDLEVPLNLTHIKNTTTTNLLQNLQATGENVPIYNKFLGQYQ